MATETNLKRINVFATEQSYNANKGSESNGELNLLKLDSELLKLGVEETVPKNDTDGYVRYTNGLMICFSQGKAKGDDGLYTFPYPFAKKPTVVCLGQDDNEWAYVRDITSSNFKVGCSATTNVYIAIGWWK